MQTLPMTLLGFVVATAAMSTACEQQALRPSAGDLIPETAVSGAALRTEWSARSTAGATHLVSPVLDAPQGATRTGFMLDVVPEAASAQVTLEARGRLSDGTWTAWRPAVVTFSEALLRVGYVDHDVAVFGTQLRVASTDAANIDALVYSAVVPMPERQLNASIDVGQKPPVDLVSGPAVTHQALDITGVQPRSAWNAAPTRCTSLNTTKTRISVHHTVTPTSSNGSYSARIRGIQAYHQDTRNWCDIGYHFMVTLDGTTWEAREARFLGTHVGGQNTNNLGVSYVGCFQVSGCNGWGPAEPPQAMIDGGGELIGKLATHYGITVSPSTVMGHRDNPGASTSCPGNNLHAHMGQLREIAANGTSTPTTGRVQGVIWDLSITSDHAQSMELGARIPGATVTASDGTTATARDGDAYWALDLAPGTYTLTATADGFAPASREIQIAAGGAGWSSMGVAPVDQAVSLRVVVQDATTAAPIALATVQATGADPGQTDDSGAIDFALAPGTVTVNVSAEGYETASEQWDFASGADEERTFALVPVVINEPEAPTPEPAPEAGEPEAGEPDTQEPSAPAPETPSPEGSPEVVFEPDMTSPEPISAPLVDDTPTVAGCTATEIPDTKTPLFGLLLLGLAGGLLRRRR